MKEKKIFAYEEARIVKNDKDKWYIHYKQTHPETNKLVRKRPTFGINVIKDLKKREKEAEKWRRYVNKKLPQGYPFKKPDSPIVAYQNLVEHINNFLSGIEILEHRNRVGKQLMLEIKKQLPTVYPFVLENDPKNTPIIEALDWCEENYYLELSDETIRKKKDFMDDLREYLEEKKLQKMARGGEHSQGYKYCGSDDLKQVGWFDKNSGGETKPVGLLYPNELDLYDMSGNVLEWCEDDWHENYNLPERPDDGSAWVDAPNRGPYRVLRGGDFFDSPVDCRPAYRRPDQPDNRYYGIGFRVVFSPS